MDELGEQVLGRSGRMPDPLSSAILESGSKSRMFGPPTLGRTTRHKATTRYLFERLSEFPLWAINPLPSSRIELASSTVVRVVYVAVAKS